MCTDGTIVRLINKIVEVSSDSRVSSSLFSLFNEPHAVCIREDNSTRTTRTFLRHCQHLQSFVCVPVVLSSALMRFEVCGRTAISFLTVQRTSFCIRTRGLQHKYHQENCAFLSASQWRSQVYYRSGPAGNSSVNDQENPSLHSILVARITASSFYA
jgi:hypothetical protein